MAPGRCTCQSCLSFSSEGRLISKSSFYRHLKKQGQQHDGVYVCTFCPPYPNGHRVQRSTYFKHKARAQLLHNKADDIEWTADVGETSNPQMDGSLFGTDSIYDDGNSTMLPADISSDSTDNMSGDECDPCDKSDEEDDTGDGIDEEDDTGNGIDEEDDTGDGMDVEDDTCDRIVEEDDDGGLIDEKDDAGDGIDEKDDTGDGINDEDDTGDGINDEDDTGDGVNDEDDTGDRIDEEDETGGKSDEEENEPTIEPYSFLDAVLVEDENGGDGEVGDRQDLDHLFSSSGSYAGLYVSSTAN
jgi:hypothetical protein